ncbi:MAG: DUF1311 domain-containing protein [Cytophagaceae bacterium]|nr:MAG: DUF1311 domain-containing protein [Cytophagaceae bacterium]
MTLLRPVPEAIVAFANGGQQPSRLSLKRTAIETGRAVPQGIEFRELLALVTIVSASSGPALCPGSTTTEVNACLAAHFGQADADLNRYYDVAVQRVRKGVGEPVAKGLIQAQRSWLSYRNSECGAIFDKFRDGTIRSSMEIECRIRLTRLRTYMIWRNWLTYPDSTPPLLPRPATESALSDGRG